MANNADFLNADDAWIWRIVHRDNMAWIIKNGLHCRSSKKVDPNFVNIGDTDIIEKRKSRRVPVAPGGHLSDYIPFYFTPFSPMALNIKTGYRGITQRPHEEIVILIAAFRDLHAKGIPVIFTDRHAYATLARYFDHPRDLDKIDWKILQRRDFRRDDNDPEKVERYQAEALVHGSLKADALSAIVCYSEKVKSEIEEMVNAANLSVEVTVSREFYI